LFRCSIPAQSPRLPFWNFLNRDSVLLAIISESMSACPGKCYGNNAAINSSIELRSESHANMSIPPPRFGCAS
jgi:hypothetical protein